MGSYEISRYHSVMRFGALSLAVCFACGGSVTAHDDDAGATDATTSDATVDDATVDDATADGDADTIEPIGDASYFLCFGCYCNSATSYCHVVAGGTNMPLGNDGGAPGDGGVLDAGLCATGNAFEGCVPYPDACTTCDCLVDAQAVPAFYCSCDGDAASGLTIMCFVP